MRGSSLAIASLFSLLALQLAAQTEAGKTASARGVVTDSVSGAPVPRVHVTLNREGDKPARYGATSGADGSFSFTGLAPGTWHPTAERVGYARFPFSARDNTTVALQAGGDKSGIEIHLTPTGSITGRVTDSDGAPVENMPVQAESGRGGESGNTDEKGQFRIGGLAPGKYTIRAGLENFSGGRPEIRTDGTAEAHNATTYYSGVLTQREAGRVEVRAGTETTGVDIRLVKVPFVRVSGHVAGLPKGVSYTLMISHGGTSEGAPMNRDGSFEFWRLDPGEYTLSARWAAPNGDQVRTVGVEIEVAGSNIENIELRALPPSDISGHLEFEDDDAKKLPPSNSHLPPGFQRTIRLAGKRGFEDGQSVAVIGDDGTFQMKKVPAGRYRVQVIWGTSYVKSMRLGATAIDGAILDLTQGSGGSDLSILLAAANSSVSGTVQDAAGGDTIVVLAPSDPARGIPVRSSGVDSDGRYSFDHIAPGDYRMVAVPEGDMAVQDDHVIGYEDQMETVNVGPKDKIAKDLKRQTPAQ